MVLICLVLSALLVGSVFFNFKLQKVKRRLLFEVERLNIEKREQEKFEQKAKLLEETKNQELKESFKSLSVEALEKNHQLFMSLAEKNLMQFYEKQTGQFDKKHEKFSELIQPIQKHLGDLGGQIKELEKERQSQFDILRGHITKMVEAEHMLSKETKDLSKALKVPHIRGRWGEIQLKRIVELAGLVKHCDFIEQKSITTQHHNREVLRPDLVIHMPGDRKVAVDSKAPLDAYMSAMSTDDEQKRQEKLKEHIKHIRSHILQLSKKAYHEQLGGVDFVVLFLPLDVFYTAAIEEDPTLFDLAMHHQVILATPTTLIGLLKAIAYGWQQQSLSDNAERIHDLATELSQRIHDLTKHFTSIGKHLGKAVDSYNKSLYTYESKIGTTIRRFEEMGVSVTKKSAEDTKMIEVPVREPRSSKATKDS